MDCLCDVLYAKVSVRKEGNEYKTKVSYYSDENKQ